MQQHGEVAWDAVSLIGNKKDTKDTFLRLVKNSSNVVRIITAPHQYMVHKYKKEGDPGFGDKIMCSAFHGSCPLCATGDSPKRRWFIGVIDRKTNSYKILDMSVSIFKGVQALATDIDWGNPVNYDVDIYVNGGDPSSYYQLKPKPAKPLSAADIVLKDSADIEELKRRSSPPTPDKVMERMQKINGSEPVRGIDSAPKSTKVDMSSDESDDDFKDFDK
jgi:hypothetical protein